MSYHMFVSLLMNISLLTLVATLLTRVDPVKLLLFDRTGWWNANKLLLAALFGLISILSTYTGQSVDGAILNTRVIGVLAGGMIGGPVVGIGAALIAGLHRYLIDIGGFTAAACAWSTVAEGIFGTLIWYYHKKHGKSYNYMTVFLTAFFAECLQMIFILMIARPFDRGLLLVETIGLPMILFNSVGLVVFFSVFDYVIERQDMEEARSIGISLKVVEECLPYLRKAKRTREDWGRMTEVIISQSGCSAVTVEEHGELLAHRRALQTGKKNLERGSDKYNIVEAPLCAYEENIGRLVLEFPRKNRLSKSEQRFTEGLASLFSVQIELSDLENQKTLRRKAEYEALQSQINPHFLFNSLNTISFFCREKPERARELLLALATYFRHTLGKDGYMVPLEEEIAQVRAYLQLEESRFGERLEVEITVEEHAHCRLPNLTIQPLVENAVRHGAMKRAKGKVFVRVRGTAEGVEISVRDNGYGIPKETVEQLMRGEERSGVGLKNVHERLKSIYGQDHGLRIESCAEGTNIVVCIPCAAVEASVRAHKEEESE